ncbi:MAG: GtrA family protein [Parahaliea sp.]
MTDSDKQIKGLHRILLFALAGVIGFAVDVTLLYASKALLGLYGGRLLSFSGAVLTTWLFNRSLTFADRRSGHSPGREFGSYFALMIIGGAVNYGVYALLVSATLTAGPIEPAWAVAAGSLAGMGVNLLSSRYLLFRFRVD